MKRFNGILIQFDQQLMEAGATGATGTTAPIKATAPRATGASAASAAATRRHLATTAPAVRVTAMK